MFDKDLFIKACLAAVKQSEPQRNVRDLVRESVSEHGSVETALGTPVEGGITTVYRSDELTILNVVWAPYMSIYPHDHRTWAVIGIYGGQEDNTFYKRNKDKAGLAKVNGRSLNVEDAAILGPDVIHAVTNPMGKLTGAIHVYGGDFFAIQRSEWSSPEASEQPYNVDRAMKTFADANEAAKELLAKPNQ